MAIISQISLFDYSEIESLGDLERLYLAFEGIDDELLMQKLERKRKNGRNDYPVRVMWNLTIAMIVFEHKSIASFRRELARNSQLRKLCGLNEWVKNDKLVPPPGVFSRFYRTLYSELDEIARIFNVQVNELSKMLPGFGTALAGDGKYIESVAKRKPKEQTSSDDRSENEAEWSTKEYRYTDASGNQKVKKEHHFGFKVHIICDVATELPVAFRVTPANSGEIKIMQELIDEMKTNIPRVIAAARSVSLDRGYDSVDMIRTVKEAGIAPVIDIRNMWKDKEETRQYKDTDIVYDCRGNVYYVDWQDGKLVKIKMKYEGYDSKKKCLRYSYKGKIYKIYISYDERVFLPIARDSKKFKRLYKGRTAVERVNGRLDRDYMFEEHYIRGLKKMTLMVSLAFIVMNGMAVGKLRNGKTMLRSLKNVS